MPFESQRPDPTKPTTPPPSPPTAPPAASSPAIGAPLPPPTTPLPLVVPLTGSPPPTPKPDATSTATKPDITKPAPFGSTEQRPIRIRNRKMSVPSRRTQNHLSRRSRRDLRRPSRSPAPLLRSRQCRASSGSVAAHSARTSSYGEAAFGGNLFHSGYILREPWRKCAGRIQTRWSHPRASAGSAAANYDAAGRCAATDAGRIKPIAAGSPPALTKPAPRTDPQVVVYDEQEYTCEPNDTFKKISAKYYKSEQYADALQRHNRQHARASERMAHDGTIAAGGENLHPPGVYSGGRYGDAIVKPATPPSPTVPASFSAPAGSTPLPAPGPAGNTGIPPR